MVSFRTSDQCKGCGKTLPAPAAAPAHHATQSASHYQPSGNYQHAPVEYSRYDDNPSSSKSPVAESDEKEAKPWQSFLFGLVMFGVAFFSYNFFDEWEREGGRRSVNMILYALYSVLGKTGVAVILVIAGIVFICSAFSGSGKTKQGYST